MENAMLRHNARQIVVCLMALLSVNVTATKALATVEGWEIVDSGAGVYLNFSSNHGYYRRDAPFRHWYDAAALSHVRRELIRQGKLQNLPVVIRLPGFGSDDKAAPFALSLEKKSELYEGDAESKPISACYVIEVEHNVGRGEPSYDELLALTLKLQELSAAKPRQTLTDIEQVTTSTAEARARFRNLVQFHDPVWSPDGMYLVATVWQDGTFHVEVLDTKAGTIIKLSPLNGNLVARPVWSPDSRLFAFASLKEVKLFEPQARREQTISLPITEKTSIHETILAFDKSATLKFAWDTSLFMDYPVHAYDAKNGILKQAASESRPPWAIDSNQNPPTNNTQSVAAPDGKRVAMVSLVDGLTRITIRSPGKTVRFDSLAALPMMPVTTIKWPEAATKATPGAPIQAESPASSNSGTPWLWPVVIALIAVAGGGSLLRKKS